MPCLECENKLWRFGESGKCEYTTKLECEEANKDYYMEKEKKKYSADEEYDYQFNFTKEMMETLHMEGELKVKIEKEGGEEIIILYTFNNEDGEKEIIVDKTNDDIIMSMLDDELDEYIEKLANTIQQL